VSQPIVRPVVDARIILKDRLLTLGTEDLRLLADDIDPDAGGIVAVGPKARTTIRRLRQAFPAMILVEQPMAHTRAATVDQPFQHVAEEIDGQPSLFADERTVHDVLDAQLSNGASVGIVPVGFLAAGEHAAMTAVIRAANELRRSDVILHLPLSYKWLSAPADLQKLIAAVIRSRHPVAVSLAHVSDPASQSGVVAGSHTLLAATTDVAFWHTDVGSLDSLCHGAFAAAVGITSSYRHIVEPDGRAWSPRPSDRTPNVLLPELLRYKRALTMTQDWFASSPAPSCLYHCCSGQAIDRFTASAEDTTAAHRHNLHHLARLHRQLLTTRHRQPWWAHLLANAVVAHEQLAIDTGVMTIKPAGALKEWIALNPVPPA
jgi:hypothetical protein